MRIFAAVFLFVALLFPSIPISARAETDLQYAVGADALAESPVRKTARFAAMELSTGMLLDSFDANERFSPTGGLHTLMTAYIAATELSLEQTLTDNTGFSSLPDSVPISGLEKGDTAKVSDLITAAVLCSSQDAALMLAHGVSEDETAFVAKMNEYAAQLGMTNTSFTRIAGAADPNEYTTCADLLRLARAAAALPGVTELVSAYEIEPNTTGNHLPKKLTASLRLLHSGSSKYDARIKSLFGGSYPKASGGYAAVALMEINGMQVMAVIGTTEERDDAFSPIAGMLDYWEYGFASVDCTATVSQLLGSVKEGGMALAGDMQDVRVTVIKKQEAVINPLDFSYTLGEPVGEAAVGEVYANAAVTLDGIELASVPMRITAMENPPAAQETGAGAGTTPLAPTPTAKPVPVEHFGPEDEVYQSSMQERFGWVLWVALAVLGSAGVIAIVSSLTKWRR